MKKHLLTILFLLAALGLSGCGGEQGAPKKSAVDIKAKPPAQPSKAGPAPADPKAPAAQKPGADGQKSSTPDPKSAANKATPPAPAAKPSAAAAQPVKDATKPTADKQTPATEPQKSAEQKETADAPKPAGEGQRAAVDDSQEPPPPLTVPKGYRYEPRGRRDPFVNPIPKPAAAAAAKAVARPDGLPGLLVSELKVTGIIYAEDKTMKKAILAAGRKTYFAKQGDHLFDAVIKEIRPNAVVFAMVSTTTRQSLGRDTVVSTGSGSTNSGRR